MGVSSMGGGQGAVAPWIFKLDTDIVDKDLKVLFFGIFCYFLIFFFVSPPP